MSRYQAAVTDELDHRPRRWLWHRTAGRFGAHILHVGAISGLVMLLEQPRGAKSEPYPVELVIVSPLGVERWRVVIPFGEARRRLGAEVRRRAEAYVAPAPRPTWGGAGCWCRLHAPDWTGW